MAAAAINQDVVQMIASEMASCVDKAVERWMAELDGILRDPQLTTLGRLQGVQAVLARYKDVTGKTMLQAV